MNGLVADVEHFTRRLLQDALTSATAEAWLHRAEQFEAARPKQGDFLGAASADDVEARDQRLAAQAEACRNHATTIAPFEDFDDLYASVLAESDDVDRRAI